MAVFPKSFDAIYENNFELAKNLIDDDNVGVNIKNDCGDTPLIAVCQQTTLQKLTPTLSSSMRFLASSKLFSYMASNNWSENSSLLEYFWVDLPLFHFIIFSIRYFILIPLVKRRGCQVYSLFMAERFQA
jgi:hypothetical protein